MSTDRTLVRHKISGGAGPLLIFIDGEPVKFSATTFKLEWFIQYRAIPVDEMLELYTDYVEAKLVLLYLDGRGVLAGVEAEARPYDTNMPRCTQGVRINFDKDTLLINRISREKA